MTNMAITYFRESDTTDQRTSEVVKFKKEIGFSDPDRAGAEKLKVGKDLLKMICEAEDSNEICIGYDYFSALNDKAGRLLGYQTSQILSNVGNLNFRVAVRAKERRKPPNNNFTNSDLSVIVSTKVIDKKEPVDYSLLRRMEEYMDNYR